MVNGALGKSVEYSIYSFGRILKAPSEFSKGEPLATSWTRPKAKNTRGLRPIWYLTFGLAFNVTWDLPLENPLGDLESSP